MEPLQVRPAETAWEILTLDATTPGVGAGSAPLTALRTRARAGRVGRIWLVTTNDNTIALRFYQRRGFDLAALHRDAVTAARTRKPQIPHSADGIPIRHELVLDLHLDPTNP
jgi:hypothetical protein